jgi:molecular chaperone HscA
VSDSDVRDMLILDPETGNQLWKRGVHGDDAVHYFKDVLVLVDREDERLLGLDLRTGVTKWERHNPGKGSGSADSAVYTALTVEDVTGPASASGQPFAPRRDDDQRIVQIGADRSATVIDATNGEQLRKRTNVADPDDDAVAYNGQLLVATQDDGYRLFAYDLDSMGEATNVYTAPDEQRRLDLLAMCGEKRACLLDSVNSDNKTTEVVAVDLEKGGQLWRSPAPDAELLVHFDEYVVARNPSGDYRSRIFNGKGRELLSREGAVARVNAGNMLLFDEVSDIPEDYSVAGLNAGSAEPIELGQLKDVRSSSCSWNLTHIVCAGRTDFLVARFAD